MTLDLILLKNSVLYYLQGVFTSLDVIHTAVYYAAHRKLRDSETLALVETAIYCATVDQRDQLLKVIWIWIYKNDFARYNFNVKN